ncbi:MAG: hypothetical protein AAFP76_09355, partial [Bacteroidota bacterium]
MKKILAIALFFFGMCAIAQTDGLTYQAVIISPKGLELPGANAEGVILPDTEILLRFTIMDNNGNVEFLETQNTRTDAYGIVNVIIGEGIPLNGTSFTDIQWNGTRKDLKVEINFNGRFNTLNDQELTYVPYAFHRDIVATGFMDIDGTVNFKGDLLVEGSTHLNDRLSVNNESPTVLNGNLTADQRTWFNSSLEVTNNSATYLSGNLNVLDSTQLNSSLLVEGGARLKDILDVTGTTSLNDLDVKNQSPSVLTGTLQVDGITNLNNTVNINNGSDLNVSGGMNVNGDVVFENDLTINGNTFLNGLLNVNNNNPTTLSGTLNVDGQTTLQNSLDVMGETNLDNLARVNNQSPTNLSGTLTVGLSTNLNGPLTTTDDQSLTLLTGPLNVNGLIDFGVDLTVNGITNINDNLSVNNGASTTLSGNLNVDESTTLQSSLDVAGTTALNDDLWVANPVDTYFSG